MMRDQWNNDDRFSGPDQADTGASFMTAFLIRARLARSERKARMILLSFSVATLGAAILIAWWALSGDAVPVPPTSST